MIKAKWRFSRFSRRYEWNGGFIYLAGNSVWVPSALDWSWRSLYRVYIQLLLPGPETRKNVKVFIGFLMSNVFSWGLVRRCIMQISGRQWLESKQRLVKDGGWQDTIVIVSSMLPFAVVSQKLRQTRYEPSDFSRRPTLPGIPRCDLWGWDICFV